MKKFLVLTIAAAMLGRISTAFAGTAPGDTGNRGVTTSPPAVQSVPPSSSESSGIVGAAAFAAAALVYAGVAVAQHHAHLSAPHASSTAPAELTLSGRIVSVSSEVNSLVVYTKQGETVLYVASDAEIKLGRESKLADLNVGSKIKVSYKMVGSQRVATRIW